jgi:tetratricopeptide (TPR) repeat protein
MTTSVQRALIIIILALALPQLLRFTDFSSHRQRILFAAEIGKGIRFLEEGKIDKALNSFDKAVEIAPQDVDARLIIVSILRDQGLYNTSASWLIQHLPHSSANKSHSKRLKQRLSNYYLFLGDMYYHDMKNLKAAEHMYRQAILANPTNSIACNNLGYMYAEEGIKLDESINLIKRALKQDPNAGCIIDSLGWAYFRKGNFTEAVKLLKKASYLEPAEPEIRLHLAKAHQALGQQKQANTQYRAALKLLREKAQLFPSKPEVRHQLALVLGALGNRKAAAVEQSKAKLIVASYHDKAM